MIRQAERGHIEITNGKVERIALGCEKIAINFASFRPFVLAIIRADSVHTGESRPQPSSATPAPRMIATRMSPWLGAPERSSSQRHRRLLLRNRNLLAPRFRADSILLGAAGDR
ncbi:MAG: hypothetical protein ACLPN5_00025 [Roseiarcus sp.]